MATGEGRTDDPARRLEGPSRSVEEGIHRVGPGDLMTLASDRGAVPMNIAAILLLDRGADLDLAGIDAALSDRIGAVPRLRQRLVRSPLGCGRPVWLDDPHFELGRHLTSVVLPSPGTRVSLLEVAASAACTRLDPRRPLWAAQLVTGLEDSGAALLIVMHHALADGIGGLAVLAALADSAVAPEAAVFPEPPPSRAALAREAMTSRTSGLAQIPQRLRGWAGGAHELGLGKRRSIIAPATSLNRPTGGRRRLTTVQVSRTDIVAAAHRDQCTVNDLLLAAVAGALSVVLERRGEHPPALVMSVPISSRRTASAVDLGNQVGVLAVRIPTHLARADRLRHITASTQIQRTTLRGQSAGPLAAGFRLLAVLRLFQPFIDHQRFVNTFVSNVRGPLERVSIAGRRVLEVIPVAIVPGNVGVAFGALSYADQFVVTLGADPMVVPDQDLLTSALAQELDCLVTGTAGSRS